MRKFYLSRNRFGYYRVHFVDPITHVHGVGKSTHTKDRDEAILIAGKWLEHGIPIAMILLINLQKKINISNDECKNLILQEINYSESLKYINIGFGESVYFFNDINKIYN